MKETVWYFKQKIVLNLAVRNFSKLMMIMIDETCQFKLFIDKFENLIAF